MSIFMPGAHTAAFTPLLKAGRAKSHKRRVWEQMGEQKPQKAKRPRNTGPSATNMAEAQRFELWDLLQSAVFKTAALNHSATPPMYCGRHNTGMKHTVKLS